MKPPTLITIMGSCASGKSTLGNNLLGSEVQELTRTFTVQAQNRANHLLPPGPEKVKYCLTDNGWSCAGNFKGGSDCIHSRAGLVACRQFLLEMKQVRYVIVNSVRFSQASDIIDVKNMDNVRPVYVIFRLSHEENVKRLLSRRQGQALTPAQEENLKRFRHRNERNLEVLRMYYGAALELVELTDRDTRAQAVKRVRKYLGC